MKSNYEKTALPVSSFIFLLYEKISRRRWKKIVQTNTIMKVEAN